MTKEIALFAQPIQDPKILTDPECLDSILTEISDIDNLVFDLSTQDGVDQIKELKTEANNWVKTLKAKCEPLEAEGKKVSDARSKITTTLLTGKESIINRKLEPIVTIERKLKDLNISIVTPINDLHSCDMRLEELEELEVYDWLAYKRDADTLIGQQKVLVNAARERIEGEIARQKKQEDIERLNRDAEIAKNAAENATRIAEDKFKREQEEKERGEQAKVNATNRAKEAERLKVDDKEHKRGVNLEAVSQLEELLGRCARFERDEYEFEFTAKEIIKAIAKGEMAHLCIKY